MSMIQVIIAAAFGFIIAEGVLYGARRLFQWLQREDVRAHIPARGPALIAGFIKYAAPLGAGAALVTLGVWAIGDYYAAKSAHSAALANVFDSAVPAQATNPPPAVAEPASLPTPSADAPATVAGDADPYKDAEFRVRHATHRGALSLKETLLQKSEAKARAELLAETRQYASRSQYDCEAAQRAPKYLKAGLDVWGFAAWQLKYYPTDSYQGATLAQCKDIQNVIDPGSLDLKSTLAQETHH
jgi:hypothetical protein